MLCILYLKVETSCQSGREAARSKLARSSQLQGQLFNCRMDPEQEYDVDDLLLEVGQFGRFQIKLFVYFTIQHVLIALIVMSIVFVGAPPNWWCIVNDSDILRDPKHAPYISEDAVIVNYKKCLMYEQQSCIVEVEQTSASIVVEWDLYCSNFYKVGLSQSFCLLGMVLGAWFLGPPADRIGRRSIYLCSSLLLFVFTLTSAMASTYAQFAIARFLTGFAAAGCIVCYFVMLMEIIGPDYRAIMGVMLVGLFSASVMLLSLLAYLVSNWRMILGFLAVLEIIHLMLSTNIVPESPRWLLLKGRLEEALQVLQTLATKNGTSLPAVTLKKLEKSTRSASLFNIFSFRIIFTRTTVMIACWFSVSFSYYGLSLGADSLSDNLYVSCALMGLVELPGLLVCILAVDRYGRKMSLVSSLLLTGIACICSGAVQWISQYLGTTTSTGTIMFLSLMGKFAVSTAFSLLYVYTSELFPTEVRNKGLGVTPVAARIGGILAPFVALLNNWSLGLPLIVMGLVPLISGLMSLLLPETKGKSLPDTLHELRN
ncbi:solute carrier family 22 member 15-like isoform X2 [Dysidea avara]|uniref:solute carrier family 22 member 15-like isoform X2 n=1 Tax=Dysidea avara TaxID=196820 RepID=UPI00332F3BC2